MIDIFFGGSAIWFGIPAVIGTLFFTVRLLLMFVGGDADVDADIDFDADIDTGDSDHAFSVLSIQSITAFMMGFGWGGLGGLRGAGWNEPTSLMFGLLAGVGMVWLLAKLLGFTRRLQSSGNILINDALGVEGTVYVGVPGSRAGRGKVRLVIGERQRYLNAVTDEEPLGANTAVRVTGINDDNTVTVTKL